MSENCIFCKIARGEIDSGKVYEDKYTIAFLDINPVAEYHTLVIPKNHYENMFDVPEKELVHIIRAVKNVVALYGEKLSLKDLMVLNNSGIHAQQTVFHVHFHIIPRHLGDSNDISLQKNEYLHEYAHQLLAKLK